MDGPADEGERFLAAVAAALTEGVLVVDRDTLEVRWANESVGRLLGLDASSLVGTTTLDLQHPDDAALSREHHRERLGGGVPVWHGIRRVRHADGSYRLLDCTSVDKTGHALLGGVVITLRDPAERHRAWETERRLQALVEHSQDAVIVYGRDLTVVYASPTVSELMDDLNGTLLDHIARYVDPVQLDDAVAGYQEALAEPGGRIERLLRLVRTDGVANWVTVRAANMLDDPAVAGIVLNGRIVTEEVTLAEQLRSSERRFRAMVEHVDDSIAVVDGEGRYTYQSPASVRYFGRRDRDAVALAAPGEVVSDRVQARFEDGTVHWMDVRSTNLLDDADVRGVVVNARDVTAQVELEDRLLDAARRDPLTGLPNRTRIVEHLDAALGGADDPSTVVVLFLDLDRFKVVNDSFGHGTGDRVLVELGQRLQAAVAPALVGRFGGDEYVVVAEGHGSEAALALADVLARTASLPFSVVGPDNEQAEVYLSGSVGIALGTPGVDPATMLHHADAAMYRAKERGRGTFELYDEGMRRAALSRLTLEAELARALDDRGFELWYQPIVDVSTGAVKGFEALARWRHRERGLVSPAEFIPVAEETGGIHRLGAWALATACSQIRAWQGLGFGPMTISVNLSPRQLTREELAGDITELLTDSCVDPTTVCLEITETLLMDDLDLAVKALSRLRDTGVHLALDDFGTGWSSLTYLRSVPVDIVKVDRSFIEGVATSADDRAIVGAVVSMCRTLGKGVVAEGVETEGQFRALRQLGCTHAQGYLFAKPLPAPEVASWLDRYRKAGNRDPDV